MKNSFILPHLMKLGNLAKWPDTVVPSIAQVNEYIPWICKTPCDYLLRDDPEGMAECSLLVHEYLELDLLSTNLDFYNFEAESLGSPINYYKHQMPDINRSSYLINGPEDLDKIKWNGLESGRFPYLLKYYHAYEAYTGLPASFTFSGPWTLAGNLYGLDNLVMDTIEDPEFVHEILRRIVEDVHKPMFEDFLKEFPNSNTVNFADAFASPPMANMSIIKEFILPYTKKSFAAVGRENAVTIDGGIWGVTHVRPNEREDFLDAVTELGGNTVTAFDPDVSEIGPDYYRHYADKAMKPLNLGLSTSFLQRNSAAEVAERVKQYVLAGKNGITPFAFFFNNIASETPIENIMTAIAAIETYGAPGADGTEELIVPEKESFEDFIRFKQSHNNEGYTFNWLSHSDLNL